MIMLRDEPRPTIWKDFFYVFAPHYVVIFAPFMLKVNSFLRTDFNVTRVTVIILSSFLIFLWMHTSNYHYKKINDDIHSFICEFVGACFLKKHFKTKAIISGRCFETVPMFWRH